MQKLNQLLTELIEDYREWEVSSAVIGSQLRAYFRDRKCIGIFGFEENFENKEEDDDSKLAVFNQWSREAIEDAKEDEDAHEEDDVRYRSLYKR